MYVIIIICLIAISMYLCYRQATVSSERMDNSPIYENISMTGIVHDSSISNGGMPPLGTSVRDVADLRAKLTSLTTTVTCIKNEYTDEKEEEGKDYNKSDNIDL